MTRPLPLAILIGATVAFAGCKQNQQQKPSSPLAQSTEAPRMAQTTPDLAKVSPATIPAEREMPKPAADVQVSVTTVPLPPFPYVSWPDEVRPGAGNERNQDFDRAYVAIDGHFHAIEGRVSIREFLNNEAKLSRLAVERNYDNALVALGATKIYDAQPESRELEKLMQDKMNSKLQYYNDHVSRTYLLRSPEKKVWFSLHLDPYKSQIIVVDEVPMKQSVRLSAVQAPAPAGQ